VAGHSATNPSKVGVKRGKREGTKERRNGREGDAQIAYNTQGRVEKGGRDIGWFLTSSPL
jgi:hypothetical protein